jgi:hypothetical protein
VVTSSKKFHKQIKNTLIRCPYPQTDHHQIDQPQSQPAPHSDSPVSFIHSTPPLHQHNTSSAGHMITPHPLSSSTLPNSSTNKSNNHNNNNNNNNNNISSNTFYQALVHSGGLCGFALSNTSSPNSNNNSNNNNNNNNNTNNNNGVSNNSLLPTRSGTAAHSRLSTVALAGSAPWILLVEDNLINQKCFDHKIKIIFSHNFIL